MSGYLVNFIVYTAAMVGIIFLAVFVYKKFSYCSTSRSKFLNVEECISLGPRKELFVVRAGQERFLVASDVGRTSLISKLDDNSSVQKNEVVSSPSSSSVLKLFMSEYVPYSSYFSLYALTFTLYDVL